MRKYDAVFLDAQGTLLQPYPSTAAIYGSVCRRFGREAPEAELAPVLSGLWADFKRSLRPGEPCDTSEAETKAWWARFNTGVFHRLAMDGEIDGFLEGLWEVFGDPDNWRLYPEVEEVLGTLRGRGYRLGIVSNWDSRLNRICDQLGLTHQVEFILASAATGMEKPDPRIFRIALQRAGVPSPRAIHVGDDYEADYLGARAAGVDVVLVSRNGSPPVDAPSIPTLLGLLEILP